MNKHMVEYRVGTGCQAFSICCLKAYVKESLSSGKVLFIAIEFEKFSFCYF